MTKIIFDSKSANFIIEALRLTISVNGYVLDSFGSFATDLDGCKFKPEELIGVYKNHFITKDSQLLKLVEIRLK